MSDEEPIDAAVFVVEGITRVLDQLELQGKAIQNLQEHAMAQAEVAASLTDAVEAMNLKFESLLVELKDPDGN